ncbi:MAG: proton-conducting transporter membrane subunit [Candidatus Bathyarchaeota archaeon]|nr:proton-conducting transporter membrane subunit [Candidatus Bathyarchaeota archaeon]
MLEILFPIGLTVFFLAIILPPIGTRVTKGKIPRQTSLLCTFIASISIVIFSTETVLTGKSTSYVAYQITPAFQFAFAIDRLAAFFLFIVSIVSVAVAVYSIPYVEHLKHENRRNMLVSLMNVFVVSMLLVVASSTMFSFLFFWEIMALASFLLVMTEYEKQETQKAGIFYFIMTHLSTLFLLFAFLFIYTATGTFNIQNIQASQWVTSIAFIFLFLAFGIKAGIIPFHKWLPYAHPASPSNISALMSGVMIKVAIYGLVRFVLLMPLQLWWGMLILAVGATSAVLGVIYALKEHDIKRLLAYHSIENIGIILIGLGLYVIFTASNLPLIGLLALAGGLFHTLNHALFKSLLFLTSGSIVNATGTRNIEEMGGLIKRMPATTVLFLIGAISISALPPFNGFVSELMIFQAFFQSYALANPFLELLIIVALAVFALTSALAAACFVKAFGITFLALPRSQETRNAQESPKLMLAGPAILAALCIGLGIFSLQIFGLLGYSFQLPNMLLVGAILAVMYGATFFALREFACKRERIAETWGCGIPVQNSKMEYTASGFSEPIVTILKSIFRTQKISERTFSDDHKVIFKEGKAEIRLMKFFEERLYLPVANIVRWVALKVNNIQRGDVDLHVAYAFATIVIFLLIIWWFA